MVDVRIGKMCLYLSIWPRNEKLIIIPIMILGDPAAGYIKGNWGSWLMW